jgi:hypothetical protein
MIAYEWGIVVGRLVSPCGFGVARLSGNWDDLKRFYKNNRQIKK